MQENTNDKIPVFTLKILNGEHAHKMFVTIKDTWEEKVDDLQEQIDREGVPLRLVLKNGEICKITKINPE